MNRAVVIVGATSAIARAVALQLASEQHDLVLAARDREELKRIAKDAAVRHRVSTASVIYDAADLNSCRAFWEQCLAAAGGDIEGIVVAQGVLIPQTDAEHDPKLAQQIIDVNYTSPALLMNEAANHLQAKKSGFICGISSVAGDRGRQSNYIYGSAKAGMTTFLAGLRNRLSRSNVAVITVKPGFVDTAMTFGMPGMFLVASPDKVARDICRAIRKRKSTIYTPWFWRWIMQIIKSVPEFMFKKMKM